MIEVPAIITTIGTLALVTIGAVAIASGVRPKPARKLTLSLVSNSVAIRAVFSARPASSRTSNSIFLPATVVPFCCM